TGAGSSAGAAGWLAFSDWPQPLRSKQARQRTAPQDFMDGTNISESISLRWYCTFFYQTAKKSAAEKWFRCCRLPL
ncbi:MAG: hypothetical protein IJ709_00420, partial [Selenomonas sp.]|nr:hypothetical protein [Selenomonas sp.]